MPAPCRTPCISASDSPSASTVGCCWRSYAWCCRLSRCACSLASAGNVCWAKPNHGFFHCQQPVAIFFDARTRGVAGDSRRRMRHASIAFAGEPIDIDGPMRCMQAMARLAARTDAITRLIATTSMHARIAVAGEGTNAAHRKRGDNRALCISRRTSRFARKLRGIFSLRTLADDAGRRFPHAGNEEPATSPSRVLDGPMSARISGLRLPAIRRRRPDRAGR